MALFKRRRIYWTDFSLNGRRFRISLETEDWREAERREKQKISEAHQGKLTPVTQQFARLAFSEAADRLLAERTHTWLPAVFRRRRNGRPHSRHILDQHPSIGSQRTTFGHISRNARAKTCRIKRLT